MNGLIAFFLALIPYVLLFIVAAIFFNMIIQIKKNTDAILKQNKEIISLMKEKDR